MKKGGETMKKEQTGNVMDKMTKICGQVLLEFVPCQNCGGPVVSVDWVIEQARRNLETTKQGVSLHYFNCGCCGRKWAIIVLSDEESWGFLETSAEAGEQLYQLVQKMRETMTVWQIKHASSHNHTLPKPKTPKNHLLFFLVASKRKGAGIDPRGAGGTQTPRNPPNIDTAYLKIDWGFEFFEFFAVWTII